MQFQEKVDDLLVVEEQLDVDVRSLETCPYSANTFADILAKIQKSVDELSLKNYSNLHIWVARLDEEVEKNLAARLEAGVKAWTDALMGHKKEVDLSMDTDAPAKPTHKPGGDPKIQKSNPRSQDNKSDHVPLPEHRRRKIPDNAAVVCLAGDCNLPDKTPEFAIPSGPGQTRVRYIQKLAD